MVYREARRSLMRAIAAPAATATSPPTATVINVANLAPTASRRLVRICPTNGALSTSVAETVTAANSHFRDPSGTGRLYVLG